MSKNTQRSVPWLVLKIRAGGLKSTGKPLELYVQDPSGRVNDTTTLLGFVDPDQPLGKDGFRVPILMSEVWFEPGRAVGMHPIVKEGKEVVRYRSCVVEVSGFFNGKQSRFWTRRENG